MLVESIIHDIHTVRWLGDDEIVSVATSVIAGGADTRMIIATCRLAGGAVAVLEFDDIATGYEVSVEVTASAAMSSRLSLSGLRSGPTAWLPEPSATTGSRRSSTPTAPRCVTSSTRSRPGAARGPSAWDGYAAQAVVEAAAASAAADGVAVGVDLPTKPALYAPAHLPSTKTEFP